MDLEQSPYLNVFPEQKVRQTLQFMGRTPDERITGDVGREICQRVGIKAMLNGSIANLGSQYVITLDAVNAGTGESLAREEVQASSKEAVLNSLHQAGSSLRKKLGESLASVQKYDKPLSEATTSSLEALKAFSLGDVKHQMFDELPALPLYQRAVELDPNFAMAYARLGTVYSNLGQSELAEKNREKAFELRDRASEHEKLYIMSHYYVDSGQLEKGITALELYKQTYPRDSTPYNNLAVVYIMMGQYENALDNARRSVQLDPDSASGYSNVAFAYAGLNRLDEAKATLNQALQRKAGAAVRPFIAGRHRVAGGRSGRSGTRAGFDEERSAERFHRNRNAIGDGSLCRAAQCGADFRTEAEGRGPASRLQGGCGGRIFAGSLDGGHVCGQSPRDRRCNPGAEVVPVAECRAQLRDCAGPGGRKCTRRKARRRRRPEAPLTILWCNSLRCRW